MRLLISRSDEQSCENVHPRYSKSSTTATGTSSEHSRTALGCILVKLVGHTARILDFLQLIDNPIPEQVCAGSSGPPLVHPWNHSPVSCHQHTPNLEY